MFAYCSFLNFLVILAFGYIVQLAVALQVQLGALPEEFKFVLKQQKSSLLLLLELRLFKVLSTAGKILIQNIVTELTKYLNCHKIMCFRRVGATFKYSVLKI